MITKNEERVSVISAVGANGEGLVKEEGCVIFLPFAFLGEKVRYKILQVKKNIAFGKVLEVLVPANERVKPVCPLFTKCGGCRLQHLKYSEQLKLKRAVVADCFKKIGNLGVDVAPTVAADGEYGYRNKLQIPVVWQNGETIIGFYAENSHRAIRTEQCPIHGEWAAKVIAAFGEYIAECGVRGYDEENHAGDLRHIVARCVEGKLIVTAVVMKTLPRSEALIERLKARFPQFSLYENRNDKQTNVVCGEHYTLLYGAGRYAVKDDIEYEFGAESFLQVNTEMSRKLYKKAVELALPEKGAVIDAFSGAGLMTAMLAKKAEKAYGVEIVREAVDCADALARRNGLAGKMENICGRCEDVLPSLVPELKKQYGGVTVVLDPPRKGVDHRVIETLVGAGVERIVYISCNPATLARDVGLLVGSLETAESGIVRKESFTARYAVTYARPFDMFPQTKHVETLVLLSKKSDGHINADIEFGEGEGQLSLKEAEQKAEQVN